MSEACGASFPIQVEEVPLMRIALYADRPASLGGIETHMAALAKELLLLGHDVRLVFSRIVDDALFQDAREHGASVEAQDRDGVERLAARDKIDILHAHSHRASLLAAALSRRYGLPMVTTLHSPGQTPPPPQERSAVIAVSGEISESLSRRGVKHVRIENGVDLRRFFPAGERRRRNRLQVVYLGRVGPSKTQGLRALHEALGSRRDVDVRYVADWSPVGRSHPTAAVESELRAADVVLATGRGVREAMACGCAALVLGAFWDGLVTPESVHRLEWYNFSGRASRERPTAERIAFAVRDLSDPARLAALKAFGCAHARRHWDARTMACRTFAVYRTLLEEN